MELQFTCGRLTTDEMNWLLDVGVDGIMTDLPAVLLDVMSDEAYGLMAVRS